VTRFLDTNILVFAQEEGRHADVARAILSGGGEISAQVVNEFAHVLRRKLRRNWGEIEEALADVAVLLPAPRALTYATHRAAVTICRDSGYGFYDALIVASALEAGCDELMTEDMQHGQSIGGLTIRNPFIVN